MTVTQDALKILGEVGYTSRKATFQERLMESLKEAGVKKCVYQNTIF